MFSPNKEDLIYCKLKKNESETFLVLDLPITTLLDLKIYHNQNFYAYPVEDMSLEGKNCVAYIVYDNFKSLIALVITKQSPGANLFTNTNFFISRGTVSTFVYSSLTSTSSFITNCNLLISNFFFL